MAKTSAAPLNLDPVPSPSATAGFSPRRRRRISLTAQYAVFVIVVASVALQVDWAAVQEHFLDLGVARETFPGLLTVALRNTVLYTLSGYVLGFLLGIVLALMRLSSVPLHRWTALLYIEIFRGLPALVIFLIIGFGIPVAFPGFALPGDIYGQVALALGLVSAAYMAETFRAGIQAVPKGQMESARCLGMSHSRAMFSIVVPQALRIVVPPLTNELVLLFKDSSLAFVLGVTAATTELAKYGSDVAADQADSTPLVVAGLGYLLITVPLGILVRRLESRRAERG
ncbi:amino acid ABC transporter permease [Streptomyces violarus]|uniref:amino acid ABC transporter permease n=1 Tax=Streptomyces violarus TaxID=67380 RepID=UPI0021BF6785|nr:amino acid ABC transporter permease [Streptomyces violarus]MCT9138544.1 amino acid ABC transporter permease [Streptomyces violarus]